MTTQNKLVTGLLRTMSVFAIATGVVDVCLGASAIRDERSLPVAAPTTALVDSQLRYLGSSWAGYGAVLWWVTNDLAGRRRPLAILGAAMFLGGVGRFASFLTHGFSASWVQVAMWVELLGPGLVYLLM
jgi:hypothetical protein